MFWALVLMVMIFYSFGVAFTQAVHDYLKDTSGALLSDEIAAYRRFWWDLPTSMLTLLQSVTGGISYVEALMLLKTVGPEWVFSFIFFIVFMLWVVVITGFFCQSAIQSEKHDEDLTTLEVMSDWGNIKKQVTKMFHEIDADNSSLVTIDELQRKLHDESVQAALLHLGVESFDTWTLLKLLDEDKDGAVDLGEFIPNCMELRGNAKGVHVRRIEYEQKQMHSVLETFISHVNEQLDAIFLILDPGGSFQRVSS